MSESVAVTVVRTAPRGVVSRMVRLYTSGEKTGGARLRRMVTVSRVVLERGVG